MELRIELLGPLRVRVGGHTAVFRTDALRVLLATLATHQGQPQRRDTLAALLSPDRPNKEALTYLRNRLTRLRQAVGDDEATPPWFEIDRKQITLRPGDDIFIDAIQFEQSLHTVETHPHRQLAGCPTCLAQLAEAVNLVRGDFLAGLNFPSETWEAWLLAQREHYGQQALTGLAWLREARLAQGDYTAVVELAQRELAQEPWLEAAHRALMQAHFALGDRNAALAQYAQCQQILADELGVEPEPETVALREAIEQNDASSFIFHPSSFPTNLPAPMGRFIGREAEQTQLLRRLVDPHYRLVTLVGTGGVGKTRLAVEVGRQAGLSFPDGVWFVSLAGLAGVGGGVEQVQTAVGEALGLGEEKQPTAEQVLAFLRDKQLLFILDNCEGVLAAPDALGFIPDWLRRAPHIALLATSREPLNFQAESVVGLRGLPVGEERGDTAVALFAERAQMARDDFALTDETLPQVRHICHLVDGSPLGIALAAAWVRRRSLAQIGAGIAQSLDFLTTRLRDVDQRHGSMRAVFEASWQLLEPTEQAVLAALAVFPSSFALSAAQAIAGATLFDLDMLCEKSLLQQAQAAERYSLHSLVRQFAGEKLAGQGAAISQKFVAYFYQFAQTERDNYEALQPEWRNLDTAVSKAHELADWATLLGLVAALDEPWMRQIRFAEMRAGLRLALDAAEQVGDMTTVAHYLLRLGEIEIELNAYEVAEGHLARALPLLMRLEDGLGMAQVNYLHGRVQTERGQSEPAQQHLAEAKRLYEAEEAWAGVAKTLNLSALCLLSYNIDLQLAQTKLEQSLAVQSQLAPSVVYVETLRYLARIEGVFEAYAQAEAHLQEAADVAQAYRDRGEYAAVLFERVVLCRRQNQLEAGLQFGYECLTHFQALGSLRWEALVKAQLGILHQAQGAFAQALTLFQERLVVFEELEDVYEQGYACYHLGQLYEQMGEPAQSMTFKQKAIQLNRVLNDPQLEARLA